MARLGTLKPKVTTADLRKVKPAPKRADAELLTGLHRAWRAEVLHRAEYKCQRCGISEGMLFADHIIERSDGGSALDVLNGQALCPSCHTKKTARARAARHGLA